MLKLITKITAAVAVVSIALFGSANAKTLKKKHKREEDNV